MYNVREIDKKKKIFAKKTKHIDAVRTTLTTKTPRWNNLDPSYLSFLFIFYNRCIFQKFFLTSPSPLLSNSNSKFTDTSCLQHVGIVNQGGLQPGVA